MEKNGDQRNRSTDGAGACQRDCVRVLCVRGPGSGDTRGLTGRQVQAALTDSGSVVMAAKVGPAVEQLRGSVVAEDRNFLSFSMDESVHRDGTGAPWRQEVVQVPRPLIQQIDVRGFSPTRTALAAFLTTTAIGRRTRVPEERRRRERRGNVAIRTPVSALST